MQLRKVLATAQHADLVSLATALKARGIALGFQQVGITDVDLAADERRLERWLELNRHGAMSYMARHGRRRSRPARLVPGTLRVISVRMDYWPTAQDAQTVLDNPRLGFVSRYALGRDYHKVLRGRLRSLGRWLEQQAGEVRQRVFVDSAPVLEKALARNAGLGWIGKHTNLINRNAGSWFFLGELYTDLALPIDEPATDHCGSCRACIDICPTGAIVAPYELDARRCISYLTIELKGSIPEPFRAPLGNRIYGCDDCQLVCPWNKFAQLSAEPDFAPRHTLDGTTLTKLFAWSRSDWSERTLGSAIRRIGYESWLRNIAVALGNAPREDGVLAALAARANDASAVVREHVQWALQQQERRS